MSRTGQKNNLGRQIACTIYAEAAGEAGLHHRQEVVGRSWGVRECTPNSDNPQLNKSRFGRLIVDSWPSGFIIQSSLLSWQMPQDVQDYLINVRLLARSRIRSRP